MRPGSALAAIGLIFCAQVAGFAYSPGSPEGRAYAPFEGSCSADGCHNTNPVLRDSGLQIDVPLDFISGDTAEIQVLLADPGMSRWGFTLIALSSSGDPAGRFVLTDPVRTQIVAGADGRTYVAHTSPGTDAGAADSAPGWTVRWVPPDTNRYQTYFYASAVSADNDGTAAGDRVRVAQASNFGLFLCPWLMGGDVNLSSTITTADVIYLVNFVFKGLDEPLPCIAAGDANCSGSVTSADISYLVGHIFKGGANPCDVCYQSPIRHTCW